MAVYSFKNVGKTRKSQDDAAVKASKIPYGIKTPLQLGNSSEGILSMNFSLSDQFSDNLKNLLLTNWGERLGLYDFGANLKPLTAEFTSQEDFDTEAIERIKVAVDKWMPFVTLSTFESSTDRTENKNTGVIKINILYRIPSLEDNDRSLQIVLYVI